MIRTPRPDAHNLRPTGHELLGTSGGEAPLGTFHADRPRMAHTRQVATGIKRGMTRKECQKYSPAWRALQM